MLKQESVKKAIKGNKRAFEDLIEAEKYKLYRMAYVYVKNETDALDIVQETVYKAFISIKSLNDDKYFSTWLNRILINTCIDMLRKKKQVIPIDEILKIHHIQNGLIEEKLDLIEAIDRLDAPYKTVILLRYYSDLSLSQISETLQLPIGTVKSHIHRALKKLKLELVEEEIS